MLFIAKKRTLCQMFFAFIVLYEVYLVVVVFSGNGVISRSYHVTRTVNIQEILNRRGDTLHHQFEFWKYETKRDNSLKYLETNMTYKKFYIAFSYSEQLSGATNSLIALAALATHGKRQVVVPLVDNSTFFAAERNSKTQTLALYFNLTAFNSKLLSHGYSTLVSWKRFQNVCQGKLDLLLHFRYGNEAFRRSQTKECWGRRKHQDFFKGFKITRTLCVDVGILRSVETFHNEVVKDSPCVGIVEWRGNGTLTNFRALFSLPLNIHRPLSRNDVSFFTDKLLEFANDFISKNLGSDYISVHIRSEWILKLSNGSMNTLVNCINKLGAVIQDVQLHDNYHNKIFVAVDFLAYGSSTFGVLPARKRASLLLKQLDEQLNNPVFFQPHDYSLLDSGSVAIVEMTILASGKQLFLAGEGSFQVWIRHQFAKRHQNSYPKVHNLCKKR